jgi:hypothetical protein
MSVNKMAIQNVQQHYFLQSGRGEGHCGNNWPTEVVEIAILYEFDENDRSSHFCTFHLKKDTKDGCLLF